MRQLRATRLAIGPCASLAADPAAAETSPFIGQWHSNPAQSTMPPGETAPRDLTAAFTRVDGHLTWSVTVVTQEGRPDAETFEVPADGEFSTRSTATRRRRSASPATPCRRRSEARPASTPSPAPSHPTTAR
jgi:hypothetical protein